MLYQQEYSSSADVFQLLSGDVGLSFPPHLHGSFECVFVLAGEMRMTVSGAPLVLYAGDACFVFPDQLHGFDGGDCRYAICIFAPEYVKAFFAAREKETPACPLFRPSPALLSAVREIGRDATPWQIKGALYSLCAAFDRGATYTPRGRADDALLFAIFQFVREHASGDCSLTAVAAATGFHPVYLSRYFEAHTGMPYTEYVIRHRLEEACYAIRNTSRPLLSVAFDCGFGSLRSFNRNFRRFVGTTPKDYRTKNAAI